MNGLLPSTRLQPSDEGGSLAAAQRLIIQPGRAGRASPDGRHQVGRYGEGANFSAVCRAGRQLPLNETRFDDQLNRLVRVLETSLIEDRRIKLAERWQIVAALDTWGKRVLR